MEGERWADVASLVGPEALRKHRDSQLRWLVESEQRGPRTSADLQAEQPWLSPEVAAAYAAQDQKHVTDGLSVMRVQWGVASFRELEPLSPADFFARYLAASTPSAKLRAALAVSHRPPADLDSAAQAAKSATRRRKVVLGEVVEVTGTAHVVYREHWGDDDAAEVGGGVKVTTLDYVDGRWWLRADDALLSEQGWSHAWVPEEADPPPADG
jgi:hypothetical protein